MGLLTGGLSFRRFRVFQPLPENFRESFVEEIQENAFREDLKYRAKDPLYGWVSYSDPDDTAFDLNKVLLDRYMVLGLRMDKKAVNGKLLQILLARRYREVMEERALERLSKSHKEEIKEALEEELLSQALPSVNTHDLAWDIHTGEVLLFATSDAVLDTFQTLFNATFDMRLYPERLVDWLTESWDWETLVGLADSYIPGGAAEKGESINEDGWRESNLLRGREVLLGSEFLSWLWHENENNEGYFRIEPRAKARQSLTSDAAITERDVSELDAPEGTNGEATSSRAALGLPEDANQAEGSEEQGNGDDDITLWLDNKLILKDIEDVDEPGVTTMVGAAPSTTLEAKATMTSGKRPVEARCGMRRGDFEWYFTLRVGPGGLELHGLKLPIEVKDGDEEKVYERMFLLEILTHAVQDLFRQFFSVRASDKWNGLIDEWLETEVG